MLSKCSLPIPLSTLWTVRIVRDADPYRFTGGRGTERVWKPVCNPITDAVIAEDSNPAGSLMELEHQESTSGPRNGRR